MTVPRISDRARRVPASPIRALTPLAAATAARGVRVLHVNIGQPDLPAPPEILAEIRPPEDGIIPYAPSPGLPATIAAWCRYYAEVGISFRPQDIVITTGGGEAIGFAMTVVADPGDEILLFDPTYASYLGFAAAGSITLVPIPLAPPTYHLPPAAIIASHITARTRAIVLINPGNPTGAVCTRAEVQTVVELAREHGLFVIADETYRELVFDGREHVSAMDIPGADDVVILVDSVSKRYSATGLRVGCVASKNPDVMAAVTRLAMARLSSPTIAQQAVIPLLDAGTTYTAEIRAVYESRRDATYEALRRLPGVTVARPEGAFYVMVGLPIDDANHFARWLLTDFESGGETVMVAPGPGFYVTPGFGAREVRLAYVLAEDDLRRAVSLLEEALAAYPQRDVA
ncbi:MAG TPA: pyridoxal phosphate-dependent aminotransferase [Chloroflexota bacterium]|nr:pyridoxal phosphate-dependent aminotransferase [Chloroflexota bacterium]